MSNKSSQKTGARRRVPTSANAGELVPREYQRKTIEDILVWASGRTAGSMLVVASPGAGKTLIEAHTLKMLAAERGLRAVAWAHRRELVFQAYDHLVKCGVPRKLIGIIVSGDAGHEGNDQSKPRRRVNPRALIQVASVGMLYGRDVPADVVVSDEAHLDASPGRQKIRSRYPNALHVGFTATPYRLDGHPLSEEYESILVVSSMTELIALGYLAEPRVFTVPKELLPDLTKVKRRCGDFEIGETERAANRKPIIGGIVEHWKRHAEGRSTVAFGVTREHSRHIASAFSAAGITAEHLDGESSPEDRSAVLARSRSGATSIVCCCDLLSTGWDAPWVKCVILARPTESLALHIQQSWRCGRPFNDITPIVLDHAGNCVRPGLGLPQEDRDWLTLFDSGTVCKRGAYATAKVCDECGGVCSAGCIICKSCGMPFQHPEVSPIAPERNGDLEEVKISDEAKLAAWDTIKRIAIKNGADMAWARNVYKTRFCEVMA